MKTHIWISYDLGIKGDYENLYYWLDSHKARECGDSFAYVSYNYKEDIVKEIQEELKSKVTIREKDRIYLIFPKKDKWVGRFIFGGRKVAPWEGYASKYVEGAVDE
jgi:hypothetical protein